MGNLEDYITKEKIRFYNGDKKLSIPADFGEHNWELVKELAFKSGKFLTVKGDLEKFLKEPKNLQDMTDFLVQIYYSDWKLIFPMIKFLSKGISKDYMVKLLSEGQSENYEDLLRKYVESRIGADLNDTEIDMKAIKCHVDVDITKFEKYYTKEPNEKLVNGLGQYIAKTSDWLPHMNEFEKRWNFALCRSIGDSVGYPGYEHPTTEKQFEAEISINSLNFLIGTKDQLSRYKIGRAS